MKDKMPDQFALAGEVVIRKDDARSWGLLR
jgi:hypothetical protein